MDDPYAQSAAVRKLRAALEQRARPLLVCMDIDSTLTGDPDLATQVREVLEGRGAVVGFNTSRTEEMILSAAGYEAAAADRAFARPRPQLGQREGRHVAVPPESIEPGGILDGDVIAASSGTRLLLRQTDGRYFVDRTYEARYGASPTEWRRQAEALLRHLFEHGVPGEPASIEDRDQYRRGGADIAPPSYRIQLNFATLDQKLCFERALRSLSLQGGARGSGARALWITDDSHPAEGRWKVFVTPRGGTKAHAAEWLIRHLCRSARTPLHRMKVLFTGDSFPDLEMGLFGGLGTEASLLLVGGSRLTEALTSRSVDRFAGRSLCAYRRRMQPAGRLGAYRFRVPLHGERDLLFGDFLYPETWAVETVLAHVRAAV